MEQQELRQLEDQCIQEQPPACAAACPIHVDVRAMAGALARGDFTGAAKILKRTVPFPAIVSRICDRPCEAVCKRREVGAEVSIRALEKSCLDWAADFQQKLPPAPGKDKRVAVVGGGLSGLTAAFDLAAKGYAVTVFEEKDHLGGSLWEFPEKELPREIMANDLRVLQKVGVEIRTGAAVGAGVSFAELCGEYDAVYLAPGKRLREAFGVELDARGQVAVDPVSLATSREKVFAGGSLRQGPDRRSPIQSMADGRRAAVSIDRYLQKVSLTAARPSQDAYETRLFTSTEGVEPLPAVSARRPDRGYSADEAVREAGRCLQCQCLECVKVCEYLNAFGAYPKKYARSIYNNLSIVMGIRHANKLINSCSICGLCREVCPEDLHMGLVCKSARETMVKTGKMPPSAHEFAIRDMNFSNGGKCFLARHQPGTAASGHVFFPGCQLSASAPGQVRKAYSFLAANLTGGVGLILGCCGAPADWSGRSELFGSAMENFRGEWERLGSPRLVLACSTCYEIFKTHLAGEAVLSLWEVMDGLGFPEPAGTKSAGRLAVHDACTTRHEEKIHRSVRNILRRRGFEIEELPLNRERTECCGYGGLMFFANPDLAREVIRRRIEQSPADYVAYCAMCRDYFASRGKRAFHLLDLIFGPASGEAATRRGPGYSQRHENRVHLKNALLRELWGESGTEKEMHETIQLDVPSRVRELMEARSILTEDLQMVIHFAETTGARILDPRTGHFIAHHKPASATYWVEYSPREGGYTVHNAYSHRMEIVEEAKP